METQVEQVFYKVRQRHTGEVRRRCPECWLKTRKHGYYRWLETYLVIGVIGVGLALGQNALGWFFLNLIFFYLLMILAALPHELGHAFAAQAVGFRAFYVIIGFGQTIFERPFCGFNFQLRAIPLGGFAVSAAKNTDHYRLKRCVMIFAGPGANLLVAGLLVLLLPNPALNFDFTSGIRFANLFLIANLFCFAWSLWPHMIQTALGEIPNDGLLMWKTLFLTKEDVEKAPLAYFLYEGAELLKCNQHQTANEWFERGLNKFPEEMNLLNGQGACLLRLKRLSEAQDVFRKLLDRPTIDLFHRSLFANNLAYVNTLIGGEEFMLEADKYSKEALECMPFHPKYKGTRGSVLVELGKYDEGISMLKEAMENNEDSRSKALNACHIAIAEKRRGNSEESRKFAEIARSLDADCMLLDRVT